MLISLCAIFCGFSFFFEFQGTSVRKFVSFNIPMCWLCTCIYIHINVCFSTVTYMIFFLIIVVKTTFLVPVTSVRVQMCLFLGMLVSVQKADEWVEEGLYICLCAFFMGRMLFVIFWLWLGASLLLSSLLIKLICLNVCYTECPLSP